MEDGLIHIHPVEGQMPENTMEGPGCSECCLEFET